MNEVLKYPIRYAIMEIKECGGWETDYDDVTVGFIASKCYVISQNIQYNQDGAIKQKYNVVFPYDDIKMFENCLTDKIDYEPPLNIPKFDYFGKCLNSNVVLNIYETYEEAVMIVEILNRNLKSEFTRKTYWKSSFNEGLENFKKNMNMCNLFEKEIFLKTQDMYVLNSDTDKQLILK